MSERELSYWAWGYADRFPDEEARRALAMQVGMLLGQTFELGPLPRLEDISVPASRVAIPESLLPFSTSETKERLLHTYGKSYRDIVRGYYGDFSNAPDFVCFPSTEDEISAVLSYCSAEGIAVIPYGGGTSVVGGVEAAIGNSFRGAISLDLKRFDRLLEVDPVSKLARVQAGMRGPAIEAALAPHGLTLRHFPQSFEFSTLGGWIVTRAGGHFATLYTHIDDLVSAIRLVTPEGVWASRRLPASGAGPSADRLVLGSEGILGIVTEAWLRVQAKPRYRVSASVAFETLDAGVSACRKIAQAGLYPSNCRLLDRLDAMLGGVFLNGEAVLLLGFESSDHPVVPWMNRALEIALAEGGTCPDGPVYRDEGAEGAAAAATYKQSFFRAPYMQSALVSLGVLADTFETACTWDTFKAFDAAIRSAVLGAMTEVSGSGVIGMRFTHVYPDGPAPYYTFLTPASRGRELEQWAAIKDAASRAILNAGGTITHHHAVGRIHAPYWKAERPEPFAMALQAAKNKLDPNGILNPGVLFPPPDKQ